jgi:nucleotide-binding universal stress UspA family protein
MARIKRILYATDFSDPSACALDYAVYLTRKCSAELHCLHVVDDSYQYWASLELATIPAGPTLEELVAAAEKQMTEFLAEKAPAKLAVTKTVLRGRPFVQIIRHARSQKMDLIVMGTHGRTGLSHMLMGSVAEKVARKSPCPVLTVRHPEQAFEMP